MQQLANAIALEVAFRAENWYASTAFEAQTDEARQLRAKFILSEVEELRVNSDLPVGTRLITTSHVAEAVAFKTQMYIDLVRAPISGGEHYIVFKGTPKVAEHFPRYRYQQRHAAVAVVKRRNAICEKPVYEVIDSMCRLRRLRLKLVRSARDGVLVLERNDTQFTYSVASESYWAA